MYKISVIVPVYNVEQYIAKCAHSLFSQTLDSIQFIFVDDCSPDASMEILREVAAEYEERKDDIQFLQHVSNQGPATARNTGLDASTGKYVCYFDSDDWLDKDALSSLYNAACKTDADILWCDFLVTDRASEKVINQKSEEESAVYIKKLLTEELHGGLWNKLYKADLFKRNNIRFPNGLNMWEDLRTNVQLFFLARKITYLPIAYYHYVQYNTLSLSKGGFEKKFDEIAQNTHFIISYLDRNAKGVFDTEIRYLKLASKQTLLFTADIRNFKKWLSIYPESNKYILTFTKLPMHLRIVGYLCSKRCWTLINCYLILKKIKFRYEGR